MEKRENKNQEFINYWEFLGIPMNSPIWKIKMAFFGNFLKIEESLKRGEKRFSSNDLEIIVKAFATLSDPYLRYLHNCEIDGETPQTGSDFQSYLENLEHEKEEDLNEKAEEQFEIWLKKIIEQYTNIMEIFITKLNQSELERLVNITNELISIRNKLENNKKIKVETNQKRSLNLFNKIKKVLSN